jgi:hypothetical protein
MSKISMSKMTPKTAQQIFDHVTVHLLTQMKQSMTRVLRTKLNCPDGREPIEVCAYRGDEGCKCAVGALIPDDLYRPSLEGYRATSESVRSILVCVGVFHEHLMLVGELQTVHDSFLPLQWRNELRLLAMRRGLEFNPPADVIPV